MGTQNTLSQINKIINEIKKKSADGVYTYRGEIQHFEGDPFHEKVSSSLWREYCIEAEHFDIEIIQTEILTEAKEFANEVEVNDDFVILTQLQHYGGKTNLIDFATDYLISLFFACDGPHDKDGRIILLRRTEEINKKYQIEKPRNPRNRVISQKSIFVRPPKGYVDAEDYEVINIPKSLKQPILVYLQKYHDLSPQTIYNDLHGYITKQKIHQTDSTEFYKGFTYHNRKQYDKAIEYYSEALKLNPGLVEAYIGRGVAYTKKDDFDRAIKDYNKAIELNPNYAMAYYNRGNAYLHKDDPGQAIKDYTQAIELQPDDSNAYTGRGLAYAKRGKSDCAIKDYDTAIRLKPDYPTAYYNRGNAYADKGEFNKAISEYNEAIQLDSNCAEAYYSRGNAYDKKGKTDLAINDYTQAIELNSDYADAYNNRGTIYGEQGKYDFAIEDFTKAIRLTSGNFNAYYNLGRVYDEKGEHNQAIENYDKVIELNPDYISAYYRRGVAWLHFSEWEKAKSDLTTTIDRGIDITIVFRNAFGSVENFERISGIRLPPDIATLLTSAQA